MSLKPLKDRRTPKRHNARVARLEHRAANAPLREQGYELPREMLEAATSDGYSKSAFVRELADKIDNDRRIAKRRHTIRTWAERGAAAALVGGLFAALWWAW